MDQVICPRSQVLKLVPDFLREKGLEAGGWGVHGFDAPGLSQENHGMDIGRSCKNAGKIMEIDGHRGKIMKHEEDFR